MEARVKVLLVDDHALFLEGLQNLLAGRGITVVGTAADGLEALAMARALLPDVILMDVRMPRCDGLAATRLVKAELPQIKIVMLTTSAEDEDLFEAIRSGASGYLLKSLNADALFQLLAGLERGEAPLSPGLAARVLAEFARQAPAPRPAAQAEPLGLNPRQVQVLTLVAQGMPYKEVGDTLGLSERTVKYHMGEIVQRLHLRNRAEVVAWATRSGLVALPRTPQ
jgi:two-component system NarL family response regulator